MEENNNTPDMHHNHKKATSQKKKTPRQRKYRLAGTHIDALCKKTRIQRRWKNTRKLKKECGFLHFLAHSKNIAQSKKIFVSITIQTPVHRTERAGQQQLTHLWQHQEEGQTQEIS